MAADSLFHLVFLGVKAVFNFGISNKVYLLK